MGDYYKHNAELNMPVVLCDSMYIKVKHRQKTRMLAVRKVVTCGTEGAGVDWVGTEEAFVCLGYSVS